MMRHVKLGDAVGRLTHLLGFEECGRCKRRKEALNAVDWDQPAQQVVRGLVEAMLTEEKND